MCQSHTTELNSSPRVYSLSVPNARISEVKTIVIACSEIGALPQSRELEMLQPIAYLTLPGGNLNLDMDDVDDADVIRFLESLLMSAHQAEHVVTCLHTRCSFFDYGFADGEPLPTRPAFDESDGHIRANFPRQGLFSQQDAVKQQLSRFRRIFASNKELSNRKIAISGWLYETEIDWLSFYDSETDQFLPLSAKAELYR